MAVTPAPAPAAPERDPIADARALVAMAIGLSSRTRTAHRMGQVTDRKASLYINTLVRHSARLLQSTVMHEVPVLRAGANGPGGNVVHYVIRHQRLEGPPGAMRFLTVGSDARLRCCVLSEYDGSRIWADYDVSTAPDDLSLRTVLDALSELVSRLEQAVTRLEARQLAREAQLEADIASAKARLSGMTAEGTSPKRHAESEEPIRPWTRHVPGAPAAVLSRASAEPSAAAHTPDAAVDASLTSDPSAPAQHEASGPPPPARRGFKLSRLENAI